MRRRQRTFAELLTRSLAASGLLYALVIAYAVPATVIAGATGGPEPFGSGASSLTRVIDHPVWRPAHARRFPGCIDMARWTASIVPTTVVVVRRDGDLERMDFDEAFRRATSPSAGDDVWAVGACG
jgi:hypothetical protein